MHRRPGCRREDNLHLDKKGVSAATPGYPLLSVDTMRKATGNNAFKDYLHNINPMEYFSSVH